MGGAQYDPRYDDPRPWNVGKLVAAKKAFKQKQIWAMRFFLDQEHRVRDRAALDPAIDSKLRGCDVGKLRIGDLITGGQVKPRAIVVQQKAGKPVQFEIMEPADQACSRARYRLHHMPRHASLSLFDKDRR